MATSNLLKCSSPMIRKACSSENRPKHRVEQATNTAPSPRCAHHAGCRPSRSGRARFCARTVPTGALQGKSNLLILRGAGVDGMIAPSPPPAETGPMAEPTPRPALAWLDVLDRIEESLAQSLQRAP